MEDAGDFDEHKEGMRHKRDHEEIEDIDEVGGAGDDSEMTCINSIEMKQVVMILKYYPWCKYKIVKLKPR